MRAVTNIDLLLHYIVFPNLTSLQVELEVFNYADYGDEFSHFSGSTFFDAILYGYSQKPHPRFPKLNSFEFITTENLFAHDRNHFFFPIHEFRELRHLALKGIPKAIFPPKGRQYTDYYIARQPPSTLQTVLLEDCGGVTAKGITSFLEALQKVNEEAGRRTGRLEHFSVVGCRNVDEVELGYSFGDTKIFYRAG